MINLKTVTKTHSKYLRNYHEIYHMQLHCWPSFRFHLSMKSTHHAYKWIGNELNVYNFPFHLIQFLIRKKIHFHSKNSSFAGEALKSFKKNCAFLYEWQLWTICVCRASNYLVIILCIIREKERVHNMQETRLCNH